MNQIALGTRNSALRIPQSRSRSEETSAGLPLVRSSAEWVNYFLSNYNGRLEVPWDLGAGVTAVELSRIAGSLRAWQLGETSDGTHLMAVVRKYAARMKDPESIEAIRLFILEEQRHGDHL